MTLATAGELPGQDAGTGLAVAFNATGVVVMEPGRWPQWRPLKRHDSHVAEQMVARAAELARDSHARTRHAAVLMKDDSMLGWGTNGVPFPGEDHCYCKSAEFGHHDMCRTHAEQRAIMLAREGDGWRMLPGSKLIYVRLEADDSVRLEKPHFCPRCSRLALSLGVAEWIFALSEGLVGYSCAEYDAISQLGWLPRIRASRIGEGGRRHDPFCLMPLFYPERTVVSPAACTARLGHGRPPPVPGKCLPGIRLRTLSSGPAVL
jgi:deoxycytidylate deaminase